MGGVEHGGGRPRSPNRFGRCTLRRETGARGNLGVHTGNWATFGNILSTGPTSMRSRLEALVGRSIRRVDQLHGYVQLPCDLGVILSIYNEFSARGTDEAGLDALVGTTITQVSEGSESAVIWFGTGATISVDLRDTAYRGPEAMNLNVPGEPTVVWT